MTGRRPARGDADPAPIAAAIVGLLGTLPGPASDPSASSAAVAGWLTGKADLLDRIATGTADPDLADRARFCATRARFCATRARAAAVALHPTYGPDLLGSTEGAA